MTITLKEYLQTPMMDSPAPYPDHKFIRWSGRIVPTQKLPVSIEKPHAPSHCFQTPCTVYKTCTQELNPHFEEARASLKEYGHECIRKFQ
jgi:hypothetical protein